MSMLAARVRRLFRTDRPAEAAAAFARRRALRPRDASVPSKAIRVLFADADRVTDDAPERIWPSDAFAAASVRALALEPSNTALRRAVVASILATADQHVSHGRWQDAVVNLQHGLSLEPDNVKALLRLGQLLARDGQRADAALYLERAVTLAPDNKKARDTAVKNCLTLGDDHAREGRSDAAKAAYEATVAMSPEDGRGLVRLAHHLAREGERTNAASAFERAIAIDPNNAVSRLAAAANLMELMREREACFHLRVVLESDPDNTQARQRLLECLVRLQDWPLVRDMACELVARNSEDTLARPAIVLAEQHLAGDEAAIAQADLYLAMAPGDHRLVQLKAEALIRLGRAAEAVAVYRKALNAAPDSALIQAGLGDTLLLMGEFGSAFDRLEARLGTETHKRANRRPAYPLWDGSPQLPGALLVWTESGLGVAHSLLHLGLVPILTDCLRLDTVLAVESRLVGLAQRAFPAARVMARDDPLLTTPNAAQISQHTPIGSLARFFRRERENFSHARPYLRADAERVNRLRAELSPDGERLVGISFCGDDGGEVAAGSASVTNCSDLAALTDLAHWDDGLATAPVRLVRLFGGEDQAKGTDLDALADLIAAMDAVVCPDGVVAHLAGALGVPGVIVLPPSPSHAAHWGLEGEDPLWFPTLRIVRPQVEDLSIASTRHRVRDLLARILKAPSPLKTPRMTEHGEPTLEGAGTDPAGGSDASQLVELAAYLSNILAVPASADNPALGATVLDHLAQIRPPTPAHRLQRGEVALDLTDWPSASEAFESLLGENDRRIRMRARLGLAKVALGRYRLDEGARKLTEIVASGEDKDASAAVLLARVHEVRGEYGLAKSVCEDILGDDDLDSANATEANLVYARTLHALGDAAGAYEHLNACLTRDRSDAQLWTELGYLTYLSGDIDNAHIACRAAQRHRPNPVAATFENLCRIDVGNTAVPLTQESVSIPRLCGILPEARTDDLVLFACCDAAYWREHTIALARSVAQNSPDTFMHVHIVNPDDDIQFELLLVSQLFDRLKFSWTFEHIDLSNTKNGYARVYYSAIRFIRLYQIAMRRPAHYMAVDADCLVRGALDSLTAAHADVTLRARFDRRPYLSVAAGGLLVRPTAQAVAFLRDLSVHLDHVLRTGSALWFLDQVIIAHLVSTNRTQRRFAIGQLDDRFLDWNFYDDGVIWTGKGKRKTEDERYNAQKALYSRSSDAASLAPEVRERLILSVRADAVGTALIVRPRINVSFKTSKLYNPDVRDADDPIQALRSNWHVFADIIIRCLQRCGYQVLPLEIPVFMMSDRLVHQFKSDLVVAPHRASFQFDPGVPTLYFMQVVFPWLFTVDHRGWGAFHSGYPFSRASIAPYEDDHGEKFSQYANALHANNLSKFSQSARRSKAQLVADGDIPGGDYIFFPCQLPEDETIRFASPVGVGEAVTAMTRWAGERGINVVFKAHPLDVRTDGSRKSGTLINDIRGPYVRWSDASIHDLITHCRAVYLINSGVGVEAILHDKPVITFGSADYDFVTIKATLSDLNQAWDEVMAINEEELRARYRRFFAWYVGQYGFDIRDPNALHDRLAALISARVGSEVLPEDSAAT